MIDKKLGYGITFLVVIAGVVALTFAMYQNAFTSTVPLTVVSDRAGLTLVGGSPVKLHGVQVGTVRDVHIDGSHVRVELDMDPAQLHEIPEDVTAQIVPPTAFGQKYVQLSVPSSEASSSPIVVGSVIRADRVSTEVNEAFAHLTQVLDAAQPDKVNNALTALATAVDGRGERIGQLITAADSYLTSFNPSLETLSKDLVSGRHVADLYDRALPALLTTAAHATQTSNTVVAQRASLDALLLSLTAFSNKTDRLLAQSQAQLQSALHLSAPVTAVLARYSPELPCVVLGLASANRLAERAVGGTNPGITTVTRIVPGRKAYTYPKNLPVVGDMTGPRCYGLPYVTPQEADRPAPRLQTGADPYAGGTPSPSDKLSTTLFGLLGGAVNLP